MPPNDPTFQDWSSPIANFIDDIGKNGNVDWLNRSAFEVDDDTFGSHYWSAPPLPILGRNFTLTTLGGSVSATRFNYAHHMARRLRREGRHVTVLNPSQGYTGSDWAAMFMGSLVHPTTDVLIWEYVINDQPWYVSADADTWSRLVFDLYMRRAFALRRNLLVGCLFLWVPKAANCWPHCRNDRQAWQANLQLLQRYGANAFGVDVRPRLSKTRARARACVRARPPLHARGPQHARTRPRALESRPLHARAWRVW